MKTIADRVTPKGLNVVARADFTSDMAANLMSMCEHLGDGETISVEICDWGVWGKTGNGMRLFLGSTTAMQKEHLCNAEPIRN